MSNAPTTRSVDDVQAHLIGTNDTVKLAVLAGPADGSPTTVVFEIWEPGGAQPDNSHEDSAETFVVLAGTARAHSDEHVVDLVAGDVIVLPEGSVHHIVNSSPDQRLYTLTVMARDGGFAELIESGPPAELDAADRAVLGRVTRPATTGR
ncbi:cupin domain-containing protein [Modestobacter sp. I12A-02628]|uniref:Cupin domain-containing protein n=1 Tax=Goekera deserti TaxID=2497753 RepID=A0A7K3WDB2_9ACTN|nr:cupin domain-containing protein [Goekera deserti]MPQ97387.1 cupin domain-containing protein [Goekera deserti]NDI48012.1 cupin domain-containing protein [Goekera deserti]NEL53760.1 cupin domain-containing protein [Goekera deserti]